MIKKFFSAFIGISLLLSLNIFAQGKPTLIKIWPDGIPGAIDNPNYKETIITVETGGERVTNVTDPTLTVYFPPKEKANGTAIVVCPGGGYARLAVQHEGNSMAEWLNSYGITCAILKYRLPSPEIMKDPSIGPLQDVLEAIRIVRRHAKEWNLDSEKIGVLGSSAGGHLAATASTLFEDKIYDSDSTSPRPDFAILAYPVISMDPSITHKGSLNRLLGKSPDGNLINKFSADLQVKPNTPPTFLIHAADDQTVPVQNSINYFEALKKNKIPVEMHIFEHGGHGFGLAKTRTTTENQWTGLCISWLKMHGFVK